MVHAKVVKFGSVFLVTAGLIVGCGGSGSSSSSSDSSSSVESELNYNGPGSKWDISLVDDGSFTITRRDSPVDPIDLTITGTYERLSSGFVSLVVGEASGVDAPSPGDEAWALEVPGYAFLLKPVDSDQMVAMVESGDCPEGDFDANWVTVKKHAGSDASSATQDFLGTFAFESATGTPSLPSKHALSAGYPNVTDGGIDGTGTCDAGLMLVGDAPDQAAMYLTANGGAIVQTNIFDDDESSFIFGLQADNIDGTALDGDFSGMLFDDNMSDGSQINPVAFSCSGAVCTGNLVTDIETGTTSADGVTITFTGTLSDNFITGTIQDSDLNTANLACMADQNANGTTKTIVSCVGQSPGDNTKMFNVLFVSK